MTAQGGSAPLSPSQAECASILLRSRTIRVLLAPPKPPLQLGGAEAKIPLSPLIFYCIVNLIIDIGLQPMSDTFCRGKKYIYNAEKFLRNFFISLLTR